MNGWRPDWLMSASYPKKTDSFRRFVWEFLRRNPDYQECYATFARRRGDSISDSACHLVRFGQLDGSDQVEFKLARAKFCLRTTLIDPSFDYGQVNRSLRFCWSESDFLDLKYRIFAESVEYEQRIVRPASNNSFFEVEHVFRGGPKPLVPENPHEVVVKVDLRSSVTELIKSVTAILKDAKETATYTEGFVAVDGRPQREKLITYLRLLDAEFVKAPLARMAAEFIPHIDNTKPEWNGNRTITEMLNTAHQYSGDRYPDLVAATLKG